MEPNMMQQGQAPMDQQMSPEDQLKQQVMAAAEEIMQEWKDTGRIDGRRITDEKEAKRTAVAMALKQVEQEAQMAQSEQAPQQAPQQAAPQQTPQGGMLG